ncbi:phytoene synthase [Ilyonectria robusta]
MGLDYWLVHLLWTIPPALLMTILYWPFFTKLEVYKISTLATVATLATLPWDSYLVRTNVWSYPATAVAGPTLFAVPMEEVFFFIIQTYITALLYTILTKRLVLPTYLLRLPKGQLPLIGSLIISSVFILGAVGLWVGGRYTYLSLIMLWVCPFMLLQWVMSCRFLFALPRKEIILSIGLSSLYLCVVDNLALRRGTWVIEQKTKMDIRVWDSLELEEAIFFFVTNVMVIFGLVAIDHAIAIAEHQIASSLETMEQFPSFGRLVMLYCFGRPEDHNLPFLEGLAKAVHKVSLKSQSMYTGSAVFCSGLRFDLLLLYYFCRVMDDLVDEAPNRAAAELAIKRCLEALKTHFNQSSVSGRSGQKSSVLSGSKEQESLKHAPASDLLSSINLLSTSRLKLEPFIDLIAGFKTDLEFSIEDQIFPIKTEKDLEIYAYNVAGTVAALILGLVFAYHPMPPSQSHEEHKELIKAGEKMGQALQYVNIARDIKHDAVIGRVYIPTSWLTEEGLTPTDVLTNPSNPRLTKLRNMMLDKADTSFRDAVGAIDDLPNEARAPIRTVVESYMMIGKMVRKSPNEVLNGEGKLKLSLWRRFGIAWWAMTDVGSV